MSKKITVMIPMSWQQNLHIISTSSPELWQFLQNSGAELIQQDFPLHGCADKLSQNDFGTEKVVVVLGSPLPFQIDAQILGAICHRRGWLAVQEDKTLTSNGFFLDKKQLGAAWNVFRSKS